MKKLVPLVLGSNQSKKENSEFKTMATAVNSDLKKKESGEL